MKVAAIMVTAAVALPISAETFSVSTEGPRGTYELEGKVIAKDGSFFLDLLVTDVTSARILAAPQITFAAGKTAEVITTSGDTAVKSIVFVNGQVGTLRVEVTESGEVVFAPSITFNPSPAPEND